MNLSLAYSRLSPLLRPLGLPYAFVMRRRRALYAEGRLKSYRPSCPCAAVGNIAFGGTGKTPFTAWLLDWARRRDILAVVLTRGYGGNPGTSPLLVLPDSEPERSGDEALMLARMFPEAPILAFPDRAESARHALERFAPDLLLMDDGMQHLGLRRDADIVLLRPRDLREDWNRVIPGGPWREDASALNAATVFAVRASADEFERLAPFVEQRLASFGRPVYSFDLTPSGLRRLFPGGNAEQGGMAGTAVAKQTYYDRPYVLLSGVGSPEGVERASRLLLGRPPERHFVFADHHAYSEADIRTVAQSARLSGPVVCTEKDAVKLAKYERVWGDTLVWVLESALEFGPALYADLDFPRWWEQWWQVAAGTRRKEGA